MGIAIKLTDSDFSENNLGQVTFLAGSIQGLSISGAATIASNETSSQYSIVYSPANTEETGVTWSIVSGSEIASISENGTLTIATSRSAQNVVIRATSIYNSSLYAEKTISVAEYESFYEENEIEVVNGFYGTNNGNWTGPSSIGQYKNIFYSWNPMTTVADGNYKISAATGYKFRVCYSTDGGTTRKRTGWKYGEQLLSEFLPNGGQFAIVMAKGSSDNEQVEFSLDTSGAELLFRIEHITQSS